MDGRYVAKQAELIPKIDDQLGPSTAIASLPNTMPPMVGVEADSTPFLI